jgi:hypothetical protein
VGDNRLNFNTLSWAAICFYYRSIGDKRYGRIMRDTAFLSRLRENPTVINSTEFEERLILGYVNIENYDLLVGHDLAHRVLSKIIELHPETSSLQKVTIRNCKLSDEKTAAKINRIYLELCQIQGLWVTGASKILHAINEGLFTMLNPSISNYFGISGDNLQVVEWFRFVQKHALEVTGDFFDQGFEGSPEQYISSKLGYIDDGYQKSIVKLLDEYFWLKYSDNLPIPPKWIPSVTSEGRNSTGNLAYL